jgi:hypothetical protein
MTKNFSFSILATLALCLAFGISQVFAQATTTGGINGQVKDPQSASVPNASVKVTNVGTNASVTTTSDSDGGYRVTNLQPGTYTVEVNASGFGPAKADNIIVEVGRSTTIDIPLALGTAVAEVQVTSEAPVINTTDNGNTSNFNQTSINELPINGRRWSNFAILSPSAVPDGTFGLISFRGVSGLLNNNTIDGGDNNQAFFSEERGRTRINYVISQAAVREFQVNTSNYSAEYGRSAGGVTNAVTKSGTNEFHGEAFYYNRNNRNGARNPLAFRSAIVNGVVIPRVAAKPIDLRQQWGGTIGGPIIKDKLFFFFSYDQQKRNFPGLSVFTQPDVLVNINRTGLLAKGLTSSQIDNTVAFLNSLTGETPRRGDQTLFFPKIDWQINQKNLVSISYNRLRWKSPHGIQTQAVNQRAGDNFGDDFVNVDSVNARLQSSITSNLLNEFRFQYGRDFEFELSNPPGPGEPQTSSTAIGGVRSPDVFITNAIEFGTPTFLERPKFPDERRYQFADTMTWIRGRHTFKFGGDINRVSDDTANLRFEAGAYSYTTANGINDFILDYVNWQTPLNPATTCFSSSARRVGLCAAGNYQQGLGSPGIKLTTTDLNFFVQDDFKINTRLTVNLGLRYEYITIPDAPLPNANTTGVLRASTVIPYDLRTVGEATSHLPSDTNNWGPRIGFAYDIFGDGKTSLRGGYGIYYGRIVNSTIYNAVVNTGNPGGQAQLSVLPGTTTNCIPNTVGATQPCSPIFPSIIPRNNLTFAAGAIQFFSRDFQAPLIHQYDVVLERQIMKNSVVSVSYIGSLGRNLPTFFDLNDARTGSTTYTLSGGPFDGRTFTLPLYTRIIGGGSTSMTRIQSTVKSQYDAVVFQFNRRFTDGLQALASYTLAKSTDTNQNSATFTQTNSPYDFLDGSFDRGPSSFDTRHKVVLSAVYAPKFYKGSNKSFYNYAVNGWSFAPIFVYYSGRPFSGNVSGTSLNGSFGDSFLPIAGRNSFRLPALWNLDARLSKRFRLTESMNLELLAEAFNVTNRTLIFAENNTLYSRSGTATTLTYNTSFGQVTTTDSTLYRERQIQFSARFQF